MRWFELLICLKISFTEYVLHSKRRSPVDRQPSTAEVPPTGKIHPVSKIAVSLELDALRDLESPKNI